METSNITLRRLKTFLKSLENKFALKNHSHLSDSELSATSMNPVQNKVITKEFNHQSTEMLDIKMLGWTVPRECPIQNEVNGNQFTQKVGRVDAGSLSWEYISQFAAFRFSSQNKEYAKYGIKQNTKLYLYGFNYIGALIRWSDITNTDEKSIAGVWAGGLNDGFIIKSTSYTDAATFKSAMRGQYLYYELATPITKTIDGNEIDQYYSMNLDNQQNNGYLQKNLVDYKSLFNVLSNNVTGTTHTYSDGVLKISRVKDKDSGVYAYSKQITQLQNKELVVSFDAKSSVSTMNLRVYICSEGVKPGTTENLTTYYKRYCLNIKAGNAGNVFIIYGNDVAGDVWIKKLMITEKYVEDTTYVDPIKSNMELDTCKADKSETTVNLLNPTLQTDTKNGVTCTNNGDGTYTVKGTNNNDQQYSFMIGHATIINKDRYKLVGSPPNKTSNTTHMWLANADWSIAKNDVDDDGTIILPSDTYDIYINVRANETVNDTFKPMLTTNLNATLDDFVPYTGDTGSLNRDVSDIKKDVDSKLSKSSVANNLVTTESGYALDARQGKALNDLITSLNSNRVVTDSFYGKGISITSPIQSFSYSHNYGFTKDIIELHAGHPAYGGIEKLNLTDFDLTDNKLYKVNGSASSSLKISGSGNTITIKSASNYNFYFIIRYNPNITTVSAL